MCWNPSAPRIDADREKQRPRSGLVGRMDGRIGEGKGHRAPADDLNEIPNGDEAADQEHDEHRGNEHQPPFDELADRLPEEI